MESVAICPSCGQEIEYETGIGVETVASRHRFTCPNGVEKNDKRWTAYSVIMEW